jgi:plastocyanin
VDVSRKIALAGAAVAALGLIPVAVAGAADPPKPVKKTVKVRDNFYSPLKLDVPVDSTVTWKWPTVPGDVHDVFSEKRPKGAKKFHSELAASDYSFKRKLTTPGTYKVICTIHEEMSMTIKVRK